MRHLKTFEKLLFDGVKYSKIGDIVICIKEPYKNYEPEYDDSPKYGRKYKILISNGNFMTVEDIETKQILQHWNYGYFLTPDDFEIFNLNKDAEKYNL